MPATGSCLFSDIDSFQESFDQALDLLVAGPRNFHARLTWVELPTLRLVRAQETAPRVAYFSLPPEPVFVTFPMQRASPLIYDGIELQFGDIMFHSLGERLYQRTIAACRWGSIALTAASLRAFGRTVAGQDLVPPSVGRMLRLAPKDGPKLLRLHAQASRIAETHLDHIGHPEVARALDQELIWALVTCLTDGKPQDDPAARRYQSELIARFEVVLTAHRHRLLPTLDICRVLGVSEQALGTSCSHVLGMSPSRYQRLRRLKLIRQELLRGSHLTGSIAEVVGRYGFTDIDHFVAEYRDTYGEMPPNMLRGAADR